MEDDSKKRKTTDIDIRWIPRLCGLDPELKCKVLKIL